MSDTARLVMPFIDAAQAQKHVTHNEALIEIDTLLGAKIIDRDLAAPPASPADGDTYIVAASPTGLWAGKAGKIASALTGAWRFYTPVTGVTAYVADEAVMLIYTGAAWVSLSSVIGALQNLAMLGINTTADATNKLAVKSSAILFDNIGNGTQIKLNKTAAGDTASFLFQTNYSGRAEIGLTGDDNFHFKVSPDGSAWTDALVLDKTTGNAQFAGGIDATNIGAATPGTGAFTTLAAAAAVALSPANANVVLSPTGTGIVTINPATAGTINRMSIGATTRSTGAFTTLQANNTVTFTAALTCNPASANISLSPSGTGTVTISPSGTGALTIAPVTASTINNCSVGQTTAAAGTFTTCQANTQVNTPVVTSNAASNLALKTSGGTQFEAAHVASAVNNLQAAGSATGAGTAALLAAGTDANIDVVLTPKGTGKVRIPTVANGTVATAMSSLGPTGANTTVQEWFAVKNAAGTLRYIPAF